MVLADCRMLHQTHPPCTADSPAARDAQDGNDAEEARWLARAREGDAAAYGCLMARYRDRVVRLAAHVLRRHDEAEDVAQEAFVQAFRRLRSYRGDGRFFAWLYQITLRICFNRRRLARWHAETPADEDHPDRAYSAGFDRAGDPAGPVEARVLVAALLDRLSPPMRATLVLRELEGLEYEEIARILDIPAGTVRSRLNAARAQFRALWQAANEEADRV